MRKLFKVTIDRSNKIQTKKEIKSSEDFALELGTDKFKEHYKDKESFFKFFLRDKYLIYEDYLKKNSNPEAKTLSIASGRAIHELCLISKNFNIICSDVAIPSCYEDSKKIFGNFDYIKLNILKDEINDEFDQIYSIGVFYIFSNTELEIIFKKIHNILKKNGTFIVDLGGNEDNFTSFIFNKIYLLLEAYVIYFFSKIFNKKIGFKNENLGYRRTNKEFINFASKLGFYLVELSEHDYLTELERSAIIRTLIKYFPASKEFFKLLGRNSPYIRFFKFKKM